MIHSYTVKNFRSLRDVTVRLDPTTVFLGRSGTGKTNLLDSLRFLREYLSLRPGETMRGLWNERTLCATSGSHLLEFQLAFTPPGEEEQYRYDLRLVLRTDWGPAAVVAMERLACGDRTLFHQDVGEIGERPPRKPPDWIVEPDVVGVPVAGQPALPRLGSLAEASIAFVYLTTGLGVYSINSDVLRPGPGPKAGTADGTLDGPHVLRVVLEDLSAGGVRRTVLRSLQALNSSVAGVYIDRSGGDQDGRAVVSHRVNGRMLPIPLAEESDGFRQFLAHLLALYQQPSKQVLAFEEPENGIFPGALSLLADEFRLAPEQGRGQVLLTTHSPQLLDHFGPEQVRVVKMNDRLETEISDLPEDQVEAIREELLTTGEVLTVDEARLNP